MCAASAAASTILPSSAFHLGIYLTLIRKTEIAF